MQNIRVRFAPSPTGYFHIGNARTALFNFMFARHVGAKLVMRIEDTDRARWTLEYEQDLLENLKWLGINWDEGPDVGGEFGPYRQIERVDIYNKYIDQLLKEDKAYFCYHTQEEIDAERKELEEKKLPQVHTRECRTMWTKTLDEYLEEGRKPAVRFKVENEEVEFEDLIHGKTSFDMSLQGDFIIQRSEGVPTLHLVVVVDDALMKISHVFRGDDHYSNTPRQILIQRALGFPTPLYAHIPMILNADRSKLSKRNNVVSVRDYRSKGYLPEAVANFIALLGWHPKGDNEILSMDDLIREFDIERVQKSGGVYNLEKLNFLNGHYLRTMEADRYLEVAKLFLTGVEKQDQDYVNSVILLLQERVKLLSELPDLTKYFFTDNIEFDKEFLDSRLRGNDGEKVVRLLKSTIVELEKIAEKDFVKENLETILRALAETEKVKAGDLFTSIRNAVSGRTETPPLFAMLEVLGKSRVKNRLAKALEVLK